MKERAFDLEARLIAFAVRVIRNWKQLPEPPITPYDGPFGGEAGAFTT